MKKFISIVSMLFLLCVFSVMAATTNVYSYSVKGTSQKFYWISQPTWETEYVRNTSKIYSFASGANQIAMQINVYDFSLYYNSFTAKEKEYLIKECVNVIKEDVRSSFSSLKTIEEKFDTNKLTYIYKFETYYGGDCTYVVFVNFTNTQVVAYRAMYAKGYQFAEEQIVEPYLNQFK